MFSEEGMVCFFLLVINIMWSDILVVIFIILIVVGLFGICMIFVIFLKN